MRKVLKFLKENLLESDTKNIVAIFVVWRLWLFLVMFFAVNFIPLGYKDRFLGGGYNNYLKFPELFSWANFDGEHYTSIAIFGYKGIEQAFFPVFPIILSTLSKPFQTDLYSSIFWITVIGLLVSNLSFVLALIYLWKLVKMDYSKKIAYITIFSLLLFPTSFYFVSLYTESIFLLFSVLSFYFAKHNKWFLSGIFGGISSATRVFGVFLLPSLLYEAFKKRSRLTVYLSLCLVPLGLILYMIYLYFTTRDPIAFYTLQKTVGEQHQSGITLLPQVFYRYVKMLLTVDIMNPIYQTVVLEFFTGVIFTFLCLYGLIKKFNPGYLFYLIAGFLIPAFQGSLSSSPRYVLVLFPAFILMAILLNKLSKTFQILVFILFTLWFSIETILFLRGYWVA